MKILLVEDDFEQGSKIQAALNERGHEVTWIAGSESSDVSELAFSPQKARVEVDTRAIDLALIDGGLGPLSVHGIQIAEVLSKHGVLCVGIDAVNINLLIEAEDGGDAKFSYPKDRVLDSIDELLRRSIEVLDSKLNRLC